MQLMARKIYDYPKDDISESFKKLLREQDPQFEIIEANAGLGADWPVAVWKSAQAATIALTVFSAPKTFQDNWPLWKAYFDSAIEKMMDHHGEYLIDRDSAQMLAMHFAIVERGMNPDRLSVMVAIRIFYQNGGGYEDLLESKRVEIIYPDYAEPGTKEFSIGIKSNEEAAKQASCRYVFVICDTRDCETFLLESDGTVSFHDRSGL